MRRLAVGALVALMVAVVSSQAHAQPSDADRATALAMLQAGIDAAQDGDWESARVAFSRAYTLVASTRVLMNLAGAQRHCGQLLEARASYQRWLLDATDRDASYRPTVEQALAEIEIDLPQVVVTVRGSREGDSLELDGTSIAIGEATLADPGPHVLTLVRGTTTLAQESIDLVLGDHQEVSLAPPSLAPADVVATEPTRVAPLMSTRESEEITQSPWFWAGVGGGAVVVIAVIIGVAVAASSSSSARPADMGTLGPFRL